MKTKRFHNIFDLTHCNEIILDKKNVRQFVEEVAAAINMSILEGPIAAEGIDLNPGLSVLAIVDFSHISVHTFVNDKEALIDIFSCREYDKEKVLEISKRYFSTPSTIVRKKEVWWGE